MFDRPERLDPARVEQWLAPDASDVPHPFIRFGNIFITPESGNSVLRVAPPANLFDDRAALVNYAVQLGDAP